MKIRAYQLNEDQQDLYTEESSSKELRDTALVDGSTAEDSSSSKEDSSSSNRESSDPSANWCESD